VAVNPASRSRSAWAEDRLRRAIVSGELEPGERVLVELLAQEWEISATPLREALRTLAGEGLIVLESQRGARVAPVSPSELAEVYELRLIVEPLAIRLSFQAGDDEWLEGVEAAWRELRAVQAPGPPSPLDLEPAHTDFHLALVGRCGSHALIRLVAVLTTQAVRFRTLAAAERPGGNRRSLAEHGQLYEFARAGAGESGARLAAEHLSWPLATLGDEAFARAAERIAAVDSALTLAGMEALSPVGRRGRSRA